MEARLAGGLNLRSALNRRAAPPRSMRVRSGGKAARLHITLLATLVLLGAAACSKPAPAFPESLTQAPTAAPTAGVDQAGRDVNTRLGITPQTGTAAAGTPLPAISPQANSFVVAADANNRTISMHQGQAFVLSLSQDFNWQVSVDDPAVLRRLNIAPPGSEGAYQAASVGQTALTAIGNPACPSAQPPCSPVPAQQSIRIQVVVQ